MSKILIIDDEDDILEIIAELLDAFIDNCSVITANSGALGIELAKAENPDTILLDITMPGMDGFQVCEHLKNNPETRDIPIIILTGIYTDSKSKIKALDLGADTFLPKPVKEGELVAHVKAMIRIKKAEDELKKEKELLNFLVKQRTEELDKAKKRYQHLYDSAPDLYFSVQNDGIVFLVNKFGAEYLGYELEEIIGKPVWLTFHKDDVNKVKKQIQEIFEKRIRNSAWEFRQICKNGRVIWVQEKAHLFFNEKGYAKELLIMCRDITSQKFAEDAIRESEQHYRTLFEQATDAILVENDKGEIVDLNLQAFRFLGYSREELLKLKVQDLVELSNRTVFNSHKPLDSEWASQDVFETIIIHKTGRQIPVEIAATPLKRKHKTLYLSILRDLTPRRKVEEEVQKSQKLESIGILAGGIAHDFNNRLSVILGNAQLAKMALEKNGNILKYLQNIEKGAMHATTLTQQLLTFSKGGEPVKKLHSIKDIIKESVELSLSGSKSSCEFEFDSHLWAVEADEGQIIQVLNNLVINADQAMVDGGKLIISAMNVPKSAERPHAALKPGNYIKVCVIDKGIGIPFEKMDKIFDPYFTTKQKGSGLGLAVAYSIIKKHNGLLTAESRLGEGSVFSFYLPALPEYLVEDINRFDSVVRNRGGKVLVMDDEDAVLSIIENFLTFSGFSVELAKNGQEAITHYETAKQKNDPFNVVIMDLTIPGGMGGKDTIIKLKEIDPAVRAIVSSGYSNDPIMANYKDYGFRGVIAKPYKMKELNRIINDVLAEA